MKNIIVWNDIPLFNSITKDTLNTIDKLFMYSDCSCKCTYISYHDALQWAEQAEKDCITIGTRPGILFGVDNNITTIRKKSVDGFAIETYISDTSANKLIAYINNHKDYISIYDDASVEGNTLRVVIETIRKYTDIHIKINLLCASKLTVQKLLSEYKDITIKAQFLIPGEPIRDCTVLFISDLINDDPIFWLPFICNKKLMYPCFYDKYENIKNKLCSLVISENILPYYKMMVRESLFVTDLDGTMINDGAFSDDQLHKLRAMINERIPITVATSRSEHGMKRSLQGISPLLPTIHYNGALIYDQNKGIILDVHTFKTNESAAILEHSISIDARVLCICLINGRDEAVTFNSTSDFSTLQDQCVFMPYEKLEKADNIIAIYEYTDHPPLVGNHHVYSSRGMNQYTPHDIDKGTAALLLADKLGFKKVIAFGDEDNDYPLMGSAHRFYAFQNGKQVGSSGRDVLTIIEKECETIYEGL